MTQQQSSADLAELLQQGFRYALSFTHERASAEDILQDAWLSVLNAKGPIEKAYLFTSIRSRFFNQNKREKLVPMIPIDDHAEYVDNQIEEHSINFFSDSAEIEQALKCLRPIEREAFFLAAVEGYTAQEIADLTSQPRGTVLSLIHRARKKMQSYFKTTSSEVLP